MKLKDSLHSQHVIVDYFKAVSKLDQLIAKTHGARLEEASAEGSHQLANRRLVEGQKAARLGISGANF